MDEDEDRDKPTLLTQSEARDEARRLNNDEPLPGVAAIAVEYPFGCWAGTGEGWAVVWVVTEPMALDLTRSEVLKRGNRFARYPREETAPRALRKRIAWVNRLADGLHHHPRWGVGFTDGTKYETESHAALEYDLGLDVGGYRRYEGNEGPEVMVTVNALGWITQVRKARRKP